MVRYASQGDPRRSMELLWGRVAAPRRGPRPGLTVAEIVALAVRLADAGGLEAVSMRRIGHLLGRSAMSLYTYLPSKAELTDLMLDTVLGELVEDAAAPDPPGWRAGTERWARAAWTFYRRHPWVLHLSASRLTLGPRELDAYEARLAALAELPLAGPELARVVDVVTSFVRGSAAAAVDARSARPVTGAGDDAWWSDRLPVLDEFLPSGERARRYPMIARVEAERADDRAAGVPPDGAGASSCEAAAVATFEFGLRRLLDGIEAWISLKGASGTCP